MKAKRLITELKKMPQNLEVEFSAHDNSDIENNDVKAIWPNNLTLPAKYNGPNRILRTLTTRK